MRDMTEPYETYDDQSDYDWDYDEDRPPRPKILWGRVLSLVVFMLLAFLIGRMSTGSEGVSQEDYDRLAAQVDDLESDNAALQEDLDAANLALENQEPSDGGGEEDPGTNDPPDEITPETYTVQEGDSLVAILENKNIGYGCRYVVNEEDENDVVDMVDNVVSATPGLNANQLNAGQVINLPSIPEGYACS